LVIQTEEYAKKFRKNRKENNKIMYRYVAA